MPSDHGGRLAPLFPNSRLVEIADSYTLVSEDRPGLLAHDLRELIEETSH
jgi:hypothetical protein